MHSDRGNMELHNNLETKAKGERDRERVVMKKDIIELYSLMIYKRARIRTLYTRSERGN